MAIAKCEECGPATGTKKSYPMSARPVGYPNAAVICNAADCVRPAMLWLDAVESDAYSAGERMFFPITGAVKIAVQ